MRQLLKLGLAALAVAPCGAACAGPARAEQPAPAAAPQQRPLTALYADPGRPDISGLWMLTGFFTFDPDKALPQLKPPFDSLYAQRVQAFKAGAPIDDVTADCLPPGMPHIQVVPYPFEIVQTPGRVLLLFEYAGQVRRIYTDGRAPADDDPTYYGFSVGRWEGDTLVVVTTHIRADTQVDFTGLPHSDALRISERIRRVDAQTLQDEITLEDPKAYARAFTATRRYKLQADWTIGEYVCEENNRNRVQDSGVTGFGVPPPR